MNWWTQIEASTKYPDFFGMEPAIDCKLVPQIGAFEVHKPDTKTCSADWINLQQGVNPICSCIFWHLEGLFNPFYATTLHKSQQYEVGITWQYTYPRLASCWSALLCSLGDPRALAGATVRVHPYCFIVSLIARCFNSWLFLGPFLLGIFAARMRHMIGIDWNISLIYQNTGGPRVVWSSSD